MTSKQIYNSKLGCDCLLLSIIADSNFGDNNLATKIESEMKLKLPQQNFVILRDDNQNSIHIIGNISSDLSSKVILAETIAGIIVEVYEIYLITRIINSPKYSFVNKNIKNNVIERIKSNIVSLKNESREFCIDNSKRIVTEKLLEYISLENKLSIEGFVNFRLSDYRNELENYINVTLEEMFLEEQNREFINLLRYFVSIQTPRESLVHIVSLGRCNYKIFNILESDITFKYFDDFFGAQLGEQIDGDDVLISVLIAISPNRIIFHSLKSSDEQSEDLVKKNKQIIEFICQIFDDRLLICNGCSFCDKLKAQLYSNHQS